LGGGSAGADRFGSFRSSPSSGTPPRVSSAGRVRVALSRLWVSARARRPTTIVITLPAAGVVELRLMQVAPLCRTAGRIVVHGHAGRNVVRFRGRVGGHMLVPGTYRITPRLRGGTQLRSLVLVVVAGRAPARGELVSAYAADACAAAWEASGSARFAAWMSAATLPSRSGGTKLTAGATASRTDLSRLGGILGANFARALQDPTSVSPVLLILLAIAICLLGLAALPRAVVASPSLAEQLTHRRLDLALAGTTTLLAVVLTYMIS
jgi:hypothetical protein